MPQVMRIELGGVGEPLHLGLLSSRGLSIFLSPVWYISSLGRSFSTTLVKAEEARRRACPETSLLWKADFVEIGWVCSINAEANGDASGWFITVLALIEARGAARPKGLSF
jgi:hypothetical protein